MKKITAIKTVSLGFFVAVAFGLLVHHATLSHAAARFSSPPPAPEFTHKEPQDWINSPPLSIQELAGKVVLIDFWTFACWNCYRSFPWLNAMEARLTGEAFQIIGVHTPEFDYEKIRSSIVEKVAEFGLKHPVMIDNDSSYWRAMNNRYWPAYYILDKQGKVRAAFFGETHEGDRRALEIEKTIRALLSESL